MHHARALDRLWYVYINEFTPQEKRKGKPVLRVVVAEAAALLWAVTSFDTQNALHTDKLPLISFTQK